jgi:hypothetical protein
MRSLSIANKRIPDLDAPSLGRHLQKMKAPWITAGIIWKRARDLHDQSFWICIVAQAIQATTMQQLVLIPAGCLRKMLHTKSTQVPEAVVNSGDPSTMLWMANLSQENRRSHLCQTVAKTEDESATHVHWQNISPFLYK